MTKVYHYKQALKKLSKNTSKDLYLLFNESKCLYNEMIHSSKKDCTAAKYTMNDDVIKHSKHSKELGFGITKTIIGNYNINLDNYKKNQRKDASYSFPGYRDNQTKFFIAFFGNMFSVDYVKNEVSLNIKDKVLKFKITENFSKDRRVLKMVRLHKTGQYYYLVYEYKDEVLSPRPGRKAGVDLGVDVLIAAYAEGVKPLIISGKYLKKLNYDLLQKIEKAGDDKDLISKLQDLRIEKEKDVFKMASKRLFDYLKWAGVSEIFVGDFVGVKEVGTVSRNFYMISYYLLKRKFKDDASKNGIRISFIEESYTSKTSFYDREEPKHLSNYVGDRVKRGKFLTKDGRSVHADVNGAAQILSKVYYVQDRENIFLKPYFIDLVPENTKIRTMIKDKLRIIYKTEKKISSVLNNIVDPASFVYKYSCGFDTKTQKIIYDTLYYCKTSKKVLSENKVKLDKLANFQV